MTPWRSKALAAALLAGTAGLIGPAIGQGAPESLLPPGFGDPAPAPSSAPSTPAPPAAPGKTAPAPSVAAPAPVPGAPLVPGETPPVAADAAALPPPPLELPPEARRSVEMVGPFGAGSPGLGSNAWGGASGRLLTVLMRRTDAPIASRWASILLRRALLTEVPTPRHVHPVDWVAERAWLLLRMGEADAARMLVQAVDTERYTPKMLAVATQVALATADPGALCPLTDIADAYSKDPAWPLARAMCAALAGEGAVASALIDRARNARGIDALLAEKVVGAGVNGRRAVSIEWTGVDRLTSWRFGLASATNVTIPAELMAAAGPRVTAWAARAPFTALPDRVAPALTAAALGVLSNATLVDLYGAIYDQTDPLEIGESKANRLRQAYVGADESARLSALRAIWDEPADPVGRYAAKILTARAAARIAPGEDHESDAARICGALMSAGYDIRAAAWGPLVDQMSDGDDAWSILAVGTPRPSVDLSAARVRGFVDAAGDGDRPKAQLLVAALAGLGRLPEGEAVQIAGELGFSLTRPDAWTRLLDAAVRNRQRATVALLVAAGMQTREWKAVSPRHFYRMIAALRALGMDGEARMIAAEAMTRL